MMWTKKGSVYHTAGYDIRYTLRGYQVWKTDPYIRVIARDIPTLDAAKAIAKNDAA